MLHIFKVLKLKASSSHQNNSHCTGRRKFSVRVSNSIQIPDYLGSFYLNNIYITADSMDPLTHASAATTNMHRRQKELEKSM